MPGLCHLGMARLIPGTCVVGRTKAGVVGGTGHTGAPILAAVLLAGVAGGVAAWALEAHWAQAPATEPGQCQGEK